MQQFDLVNNMNMCDKGLRLDTREEDSAHVGGPLFQRADARDACVPHLDVVGFRSELMCAFDREGSSRDCQAFVITCIGLRGQSGTLQTQSGLLGRMRETVLTAEVIMSYEL